MNGDSPGTSGTRPDGAAAASTSPASAGRSPRGPTRRRRCAPRRRAEHGGAGGQHGERAGRREEQPARGPPVRAGRRRRAAPAAEPEQVQQAEQRADAGRRGEDGGDDAGRRRRRAGRRGTRTGRRAPNATKPATPTHGRRTDALPSTAPSSERDDDDAGDEGDLVVRAEQGDREVLQRRREAVDELRADGRDQRRPEPAMPAHQLADAERDAGGDDAGEGARRPARPAVAVGGDGSALPGRGSVATAMARRYARVRTSGARSRNGRETPRPPARRRRGTGVLSPPWRRSTTRRPEVLVVDDEPMVREVVATLPAARRLRVARGRPTAPSAGAGWQTHRPDLVVLDIMLPGTDGLTILRRLRADGRHPGDPAHGPRRRGRPRRRPRARRRRLRRQAVLARELAARVRTVLRRAAAPAAADGATVIETGGLRIDPVDPRGPRRRAPRRADAEGVRPPAHALPARRAGCSPAASCWPTSGTRRPSTRTRRRSRCTSGGCARSWRPTRRSPRWITTARGVGYRFEP